MELCAARIPYLGWIAEHYWFVVTAHGTDVSDRWEVWQQRDVGGDSWGHLHKNLLPAHAGVGAGPSRVETLWHDDEASKLSRRIALSPVTYPWRDRYRYWPGPNSNTYVQWVLAGTFSLARKAVGRRYARHA